MTEIQKITKDLSDLRAEIESAKNEEQQLRGKEQQQEESIQRKFKVKTDAAGEKLLEKWDKQMASFEEKIKVGYKKLKDDYEW